MVTRFLFERLCPDLMVDSVLEIDGDWLSRRHVKGILLDVDNTLLARDRSDVPEKVGAWVKGLSDRGVGACIISNNWSSRVGAVANQLDVAFVAPAIKPLPGAFRRGLAELGTTAADTAVVGDQLFTDVLGGKRLGLMTVLVRPVSSADLPYTRLLRVFERWVISNLERHQVLVSRPDGGKTRAVSHS